jgi:hypothetical protein
MMCLYCYQGVRRGWHAEFAPCFCTCHSEALGTVRCKPGRGGRRKRKDRAMNKVRRHARWAREPIPF